MKEHYCGTKRQQLDKDILQHLCAISDLEEEQLLKLYSTILDNCFVTTSLLRLSCLDDACLFEKTCKLNHRCCRPNCEWFVDPMTCCARVFAIRDIDAGDWLTHSYTKVTLPTTESRRRYTKEYLGFVCQCEDCEYGLFSPPNRSEPMVPLLTRLSSESNPSKILIIVNLLIDTYSAEMWRNFWDCLCDAFQKLFTDALSTTAGASMIMNDRLDGKRLIVLWKKLLLLCQNSDLDQEQDSRLVYSASVCLRLMTDDEYIIRECKKLSRVIELRWLNSKHLDFRLQRIYLSNVFSDDRI